MRVIVTVQHPGHVHFFRHAIRELVDRGHEVKVFARENQAAVDLLERLGVPYETLAGAADSLPSLAAAQGMYEARLLRRARQFDPDVMTAIGGVAVSHVASLVGARSVVFYDTEHATLIHRLAYPFADVVCTPDCYRDDVGEKQVRYPGYHELAYLSPARFTPDEDVLDDVDAETTGDVALVRLGDWSASHDVGADGIDDPVSLVETLESRGATVLLSADGAVPPELESHTFSLAPDRFHDLLAAVDLYVGEGATTAAECAVLGTPAVYVSDLQVGYLAELEAEYGLVVNCTGSGRPTGTIDAATTLLDRPTHELQRRRCRLLAETVDTTYVILEQVTGSAEPLSTGTGAAGTTSETVG